MLPTLLYLTVRRVLVGRIDDCYLVVRISPLICDGLIFVALRQHTWDDIDATPHLPGSMSWSGKDH
jgi:hypothetical protein